MSNQKFQDNITSHQIGILRLSTQQANKINKILSESDEDLKKELINAFIEFGVLSTAIYLKNKKKIDKRINSIVKSRTKTWKTIRKDFMKDFDELVEYESDFTRRIFEKSYGVEAQKSDPNIKEARKRPIQGRTAEEWVNGLAAGDLSRVKQAVLTGITSGLGTRALARSVFGTKSANGSDGVTQISRNAVNSITRTVNVGATSFAREDFFLSKAEPNVKWVSVLDSRTTAICQSLDGKIYSLNEGPRPPAHIGCRSIVTMFFDGDALETYSRPTKRTETSLRSEASKLNDKFSELSKKEQNEFIENNKSKLFKNMAGKVPAETTYAEWLKRQNKTLQQEALGVKRQELFSTGKISLDRFVDKTGRQYTLKELKKREKEIFDLID